MLLLADVAWAIAPVEMTEPELLREIERLRALPFREMGPAARGFLFALSAEQVAFVRPQLLAKPASVNDDTLLGLLFERWGALDGPAAYAAAAATTSIYRTSNETNALAGWATYQPRVAWDRLMAVTNRGADRRYDEETVLAVIAERDLRLALELFEDLASDRSCLTCNASMLTATAIHTGQASLIVEAIARMQPGPNRNALRDGYWDVLGRYALPKALAEISAVKDPTDARAARVHLAVGWASRDFASCFEHILANYDRETMEQALLPVIQRWAVAAVPEDVAAVVKKLPTNLSERSLLGLVPVLARVDPASATAWAASLPASAVRDECLRRGMWHWTLIDAEQAHGYFAQASDVETAGTLLWSYLLARVGNSTLRLDDFADVTDRFKLQWRVRLLAQVSLRLADPAANRSGAFDLKAYERWVEAQPDYSEAQRAEILRPLRTPPEQ